MNRRRFLSLAAGLSVLPLSVHAVTRPPALRRLRLKNAHTGETFEGPYRDEKGGPIEGAMDDLSLFLRDHHSGAVTHMDVGVLDFLADILDAVHETDATILSAYRTAETNAMLARTHFGVAENSQHIYGRALDLFLGQKLADAMTTAREMKRGGVGWYPHSSFIHIDTGPVRNWTLDETGLDRMLFDMRQIVIGGGSGDHTTLVLRGSHGPLSVGQRLALHRQLAHAEFLARHH